MKLFTATFFTASLISLHALVAQDANTVPVPDSSQPVAPGQPSLFPGGTPPPIVGKPSHGSGDDETDHPAGPNPILKKNPSAQTTEDITNNIAYRKAKTIALRDEKVQQALADAATAKNAPDKFAAMKRYYTLLADRILKINGGIKKLVTARLKDSLKELDQSKVRPEDYPEQAAANQ